MPKYRKKPVVIEAIQWSGDNLEQIQEFVTVGIGHNPDNHELLIPTLEGNLFASKSDYIIKGVSNEFYPCKADIFEKTYDKVKD